MTTVRTSFDPSGVKASLAEFGTPTGDTADGDVNISGQFLINGAAFAVDTEVLTAAQIAAPTAEILAALDTLYRLDVPPYTRYQSTGTALVQIGQAGGATLAANQTFTGSNTFTGAFSIGDGTAAVNPSLNGAAGTVRSLHWRTAGTNRWQLIAQSAAESGSNAGSDLLLGSYSDAGAFLGTAFDAQRTSGFFGNGGPYFSTFSPMIVNQVRTTTPGGVIGNEVNFLTIGDTQPTTTLGANPLSVTNGSPTVTVTWTGACGSSGPLYTGNSEAWVNLSGATAVGGITPSGWYKVASIVNVNTFTITHGSNATSTATGGGSAVTATPSFVTQGEKFFETIKTGAAGYAVGRTEYVVFDPAFYQLQSGNRGPQYQARFGQVYTPNDTSQLNYWGTVFNEQNFINRGADEGYSPNLSGAPRPTIGTWYGPETSVPSFVSGGGTAHNWNTVHGVFGRDGLAAVYDAFSVQPNALVGAAIDPTGHGGVGCDTFGSYSTLSNATPFSTAIGTPTITVRVSSAGITGGLAVQVNGGSVYIPSTYTISGVTFGGGTYVMASVNAAAGTFAITGTGNAAATTTGGGSGQVVYFANLVPYAPHQFWGSFKHGIVANTLSRFEDGLIISSIPGAGVGWNDGTGTASVTGTEISAGNVEITLTPAGTGTINAVGLTKLKAYTVATLPAAAAGNAGCIAYVTDATAPTYRGALTGGGAVKTLVFSDGSAWTSH